MYKFQGRQPYKLFRMFKLFFLNKAVLILFFHQQITRFEKQNLLKSVFLLNFISSPEPKAHKVSL